MNGLPILPFFIFPIALFSQSVSICFEEQPWEQVLEEAASHDQPIFLYLHASWCIPCRRMEREVFSHPSVYAFYDEHFINYRVDVDSEAWDNLKGQYDWSALPSFLYLNSGGDILHAVTGFQEADRFVKTAREALAVKVSLSGRMKAYHAGKVTPDALYELAYLLRTTGDQRRYEVAASYLNAIGMEALHEENNWKLFNDFTTDIHAPQFRYVTAHVEAFYKTIGRQGVHDALTSIALRQVREAARLQDEKLFQEIVELLEEYAPPSRKLSVSTSREVTLAKKSYYEQTGNWEDYAEAAIPYIEDHSFRIFKFHLDFMNSEEFPDFLKEEKANLTLELAESIIYDATLFYEHIQNKRHLKKATKWVREVIAHIEDIEDIEIAPDCGFYLLYAQLLHKRGLHQKARKAAGKTLAISTEAENCKLDAAQLLDEME